MDVGEEVFLRLVSAAVYEQKKAKGKYDDARMEKTKKKKKKTGPEH